MVDDDARQLTGSMEKELISIKWEEKKLGWNKTQLKLVFLRTSFRSKLVQIKLVLKYLGSYQTTFIKNQAPLYLVSRFL